MIDDARRRQRRRRRALAAIAGAAGIATAIAAAVTGLGDDGPTEHRTPSATLVPAAELLARDPYLGVACPVPNSIACDRVGLAVWLRRPAADVAATVAGRSFVLRPASWGGPAPGTVYTGFLQPAGVVDRLGVTPDAGPRRWLGGDRPDVPVGLRVTGADGRTVLARVRTPLAAGWG